METETETAGAVLRDLEDDHVLIGTVVKAHGIKGEVRVYPYSGSPANFHHYREVVLAEPGSNTTRSFALSRSRTKDAVAIIHLAGITSESEAEALRGFQVWLKKSDLPALAPGEYYWHKIQGLPVVTDDGRELGTVTGIFNNKAHDILVVRGKGREYLVPMREGVVAQDNDGSGPLIVASASGLFDWDEE